jgi:hypothetical protein
MVVTVCESEDAYRSFEREKLMPTFQRLGVTSPPPLVQVAPLDGVLITPTAGQARALMERSADGTQNSDAFGPVDLTGQVALVTAVAACWDPPWPTEVHG